MIVQELIARYLAHAERRGIYSSPDSWEERARTLRDFSARYGPCKVDSLVPANLTDWIEDHPSWKSSSTCRGKFATVMKVMNWAAQEKRIACNPLLGAERYEEAERRPCLEDTVLEKLLAATDVRFAHALLFLRGTGCRLGDMANLTWPMILWEQSIAVIGQHKTRKHTGRAKVVAIPESVVKMLREMRSISSEGLVFTNRDGQKWTTDSFGKRLRRLKVRLGLTSRDIGTTHGLRHQWATVAYLNSGDIKLVSLGLGHRSVAITEKFYVNVEGNLELLRRAAEAANRPPPCE